jgi:hypothetical protein
MKLAILSGVLGVALAAAAVAQQSAPPPNQAPAGQPPAPAAAPPEVEALQAMFNAADPDARIKASEDLLTKFADTEFKPYALLFIADSYRQKNDFEKMVVYAERTVEADPKNLGPADHQGCAPPESPDHGRAMGGRQERF